MRLLRIDLEIYALTELGQSAFPILEAMHLWGVSRLGLEESSE
jgi:DNA-binding HxlR family transcriptional regulator